MLISIFYNVVPFLIILSILVFVHEFGHYWMARRQGIHVEVFSIGLGPEVFGWYDRHGTRWRVSLFPLGGYVRMLSDADAASGIDHEALSHMSEEDKVRAHHTKTPWQKIKVAAAGPLANYIFAVVLLAGLFWLLGEKMPNNENVIGLVHMGAAADRAGLKMGDRILRVDGKKINAFSEMAHYAKEHPGKNIQLQILRENQNLIIRAQLESRSLHLPSGTQEIGVLGIEQSWTYKPVPFLTAVGLAFQKTFDITWMSFKSIVQMIMGDRSTKDLMGPLGIAKSVANFARAEWQSLISVAAFLSISLGFINLLPIPLLDGGQIVLYAVEAARGQPLSIKAQEWISFVGLGIVLMLFVISTWNDIGRFAWVKAWLNKW